MIPEVFVSAVMLVSFITCAKQEKGEVTLFEATVEISEGGTAVYCPDKTTAIYIIDPQGQMSVFSPVPLEPTKEKPSVKEKQGKVKVKEGSI